MTTAQFRPGKGFALWLVVTALACRGPELTSARAPADAGEGAPDGGADRPAWFQVSDAAAVDAVTAAPRCVNLQCQRPVCPGTATTSLSGTAFAPNGKLPLYNVAVYVPNAPLAPLARGMGCDRCGTTASGSPIASAITDAEGKFRIENVPAGKDIPLVVQVGKWRRRVTIPSVKPCVDNPLTDPELTRLPRNRGEGDLPSVAVTTGQCDSLACTVAKLGVDPTELGVLGQDRAFTYFQGNSAGGPPGMAPAPKLWGSFAELQKYDFVVFNSLCLEYVNSPAEWLNRDAAAFDAVTRYLNAGGRIFASGREYVWAKHSPDRGLAGAMGFPTVDQQGDGKPPITIDTRTPKSKALVDWLKFVNPAASYAQIGAEEIYDHLRGPAVGGQIWASSPSNRLGRDLGNHPRVLTFNTPIGVPVEQQCGRLTMFNMQVAKRGDFPPSAFPAICGELTTAEYALAFLLFDLAACIQNEEAPPAPPVVIP